MRIRDCFTVDLEARGESVRSLRTLALRLLLNPGARAVGYFRLAVLLRKARRLRRINRMVAELLLVRICRVPGLEIRTIHEIGPGLVAYHPHDIVIGEGRASDGA